MLRVRSVQALAGRRVRLTLTDGSRVERDLTDVLRGPAFEPVARDDRVFRQVRVGGGTIEWPGDVDVAPETLIWNGPEPSDESASPPPFLRLTAPPR